MCLYMVHNIIYSFADNICRLTNGSGLIADDVSGSHYSGNVQCLFLIETDRYHWNMSYQTSVFVYMHVLLSVLLFTFLIYGTW